MKHRFKVLIRDIKTGNRLSFALNYPNLVITEEKLKPRSRKIPEVTIVLKKYIKKTKEGKNGK